MIEPYGCFHLPLTQANQQNIKYPQWLPLASPNFSDIFDTNKRQATNQFICHHVKFSIQELQTFLFPKAQPQFYFSDLLDHFQ